MTEAIYINYYHSPLGLLEIRSTEDSVTSILFANSEKQTEEKNSLPKVMVQCIEQLDEYFLGKRKIFQVPISQSGTDFQKKVWKELEQIPYGRTISYLELSKRIGDVKSVRAAGTANGQNKISIIVPCHRVIGSNGSLVGYSGGMKNKQWLLEQESKFSSGVQKLF